MKNFITEFINWSNFFEQKDVIDELSKIEKKLNNSPEKDSFWINAPFSVDFNETGKYKVVFSIKVAGNDQYNIIAEKIIQSE